MIAGMEKLQPEVRNFFESYLEMFKKAYIDTLGQKTWDSLTNEQRLQGALMMARDLEGRL